MNKNTLKLHLGILDNVRKDILQKLLPFSQGFILSGGTALALQLAHRKSFDFDFFSASPIPEKLLEKISQSLKIKNIVVDTADELTFFTKNEVKITFLYYPFKPYYKNLESKDGFSFFSVPEIAIQKAYTIGRRGEYRDYFDLYIILKNKHTTLKQLIIGAKKVYGNVFDEKIFLEQLIYFKDLLNFELIPADSIKLPNPEEIRLFFTELIKSQY